MDHLLIKYYERGFFILGSALLEDELEKGSNEITHIFNELSEQQSDLLFWRTTTDGTLVPDRIDPILDQSEFLSELVMSSRVLFFLEKILDDKPMVFKDKAIFKRPGTTGYGLHQDYSYWASRGIPPNKMVTVWFVFDHANRESGTMEVFSGHHSKILPGPKHNPMDTDPTLVDWESSILVELSPGDLLIFHPLLPHLSGPNYSKRERKALFVTYTTPEFSDHRKIYYQGMDSLRKYYDQKKAF